MNRLFVNNFGADDHLPRANTVQPRLIMETGTVKLPKALINMSWLMMPMLIDVRGLFVSCQDLGDTKGSGSRISADLFGGT